MKTSVSWVAAAGVCCLALSGCVTSANDAAGGPVASASVTAFPSSSSDARGPNGETPVDAASITLTPAELTKLKAAGGTVGLIWADPADPALVGLKSKLTDLGLPIAAEVDTNFDIQKEFDAVKTMLAKKPSVVIALITDNAASAKNFQPLVDAKIPLIFEENIPTGYTQGKDFAADVAQDYPTAAKYAADIIAQAMGDEGKLGFLTYSANFFITNQWDKAFKARIASAHPKIQLVEAGFPDPAKVQDVAAGLLARNPDLKGMYATWNDPLDKALAAMRAAGRTNIPATTVGMGESTALAIAKRTQVPGVGGVASYTEGAMEATLAAYIILGKATPALVISPGFAVTRDNLADGWKQTYQTPLPAAVQQALAK